MRLFVISIRHMTKVLLLTLLCAQSMTPAMGYEGDVDFTRRTPVSEAALDHMRGGFQSNQNGPVMSFGIEKSVWVNGQLVTSTVLNIPDLMKLDGDQNQTFTHIQTGDGNTLPPGMALLPTDMTVLQNTLDNQILRDQTIINATVESLDWARSLALGDALSQATVGAIRH
ncbi:MAG: hypothetical protein L0H94_01420 [Nitrospira sp.]|nr:hypothetical protein [Nitrospira sp.]